MANISQSGSEPCLHDDDVSSQPSHDGVYSPMSNYSTYSHEIKYIFEPLPGNNNNNPDDEDGGGGDSDYMIIPPRNKSSSLSQQQLMTQSALQLSQHSTPRTLSSQQRTSSSSQLYRRTYSTSSCHSDHSNKENNAPHPHPHPVPSEPHHSGYPYPYPGEDRRKTWSPAGLKFSIPANFQSVRGCHSNSNLEADPSQLDNIYEDCDRGPPRLAPMSGVLSSPLNVGRSIVRPIAFKPVHSAKHVSPPQGSKRRLSNQDEGYGSHDYNHMTGSMTSGRNMNSSHGSHNDGSERSTSFSSDFSRPMDRPESLPSLNASHVSSNMEVFPNQTPSPSDSGVGELEAMLKEKDAELNTLRDVMDRNERAIFQVYDEKKSAWAKEMRELREEYERKFKIQQRKNYKTEQVLSLQVYKLQQEKKTLKDEYDKIYLEKDILRKECSSYQGEVRDLKVRLDGLHNNGHPVPDVGETLELRRQVRDLNQEVTQKSREVLTLRTHLHTNEAEMDKKNKELSDKFREILSKTEELKSLKNELGKLSTDEPLYHDVGVQHDAEYTECVTAPELLKPSIVSSKDKTITELKSEVGKLRGEILGYRANFEKDKETWLDEKNKVIRYQKQLQLNYVQMYRKNRTLEAEVEQLTLELENRDLKLMAMNGEESVC